MIAAKITKTGAKRAMLTSLLLLSACAAPNGSMSSKGDVFETPMDLCSVEPTQDVVDALRARADYAELLVFLGRTCPEQADLFGIGATGSLPSLEMVPEDGGRGIVVLRRAPAEDGRDVPPPSPPADDGSPVVVTDPPPEEPGPVAPDLAAT